MTYHFSVIGKMPKYNVIEVWQVNLPVKILNMCSSTLNKTKPRNTNLFPFRDTNTSDSVEAIKRKGIYSG